MSKTTLSINHKKGSRAPKTLKRFEPFVRGVQSQMGSLIDDEYVCVCVRACIAMF
jgi:hypothetical protein